MSHIGFEKVDNAIPLPDLPTGLDWYYFLVWIVWFILATMVYKRKKNKVD